MITFICVCIAAVALMVCGLLAGACALLVMFDGPLNDMPTKKDQKTFGLCLLTAMALLITSLAVAVVAGMQL